MSKARPSVNLAIGATRGWKRAPDDAPEPGGYDAGPAPGHQRPTRAQLTWGPVLCQSSPARLRPPIPSGAAASMPEITERAGLARLRAAPARRISAEITQLCALRIAENPRLKTVQITADIVAKRRGVRSADVTHGQAIAGRLPRLDRRHRRGIRHYGTALASARRREATATARYRAAGR